MTLSIIIVNWNTRNLLRNCLISIYQHTRNLDSEVIVVDNASSDNSMEMVKQEFPNVILIVNSENLGFAKANNLGYVKSRGEYVLFLNSDTLVKENSIQKMLAALQKNQNIGALSPKLIYPNGKFQADFYRKFPGLCQTFWVYLPPLNRLTFKIKFLRRRYLTDIDEKKSCPLQNLNLPGACLMTRRTIFQKVNGWDENFWLWMEDVDLSWQIKKDGEQLFYLAEAEIIHLGGQSFAQWNDFEKIYNFRLSYLKYFRKNKGKLQAGLVKWLFILNGLSLILPLLFFGFFAKKYWQKSVSFWRFIKEFSQQ